MRSILRSTLLASSALTMTLALSGCEDTTKTTPPVEPAATTGTPATTTGTPATSDANTGKMEPATTDKMEPADKGKMEATTPPTEPAATPPPAEKPADAPK